MQSLASEGQNLVNLFNDFVVIIVKNNLHRYMYGTNHDPNIANKHFLNHPSKWCDPTFLEHEMLH
jgi:hypothetical protein